MTPPTRFSEVDFQQADHAPEPVVGQRWTHKHFGNREMTVTVVANGRVTLVDTLNASREPVTMQTAQLFEHYRAN